MLAAASYMRRLFRFSASASRSAVMSVRQENITSSSSTAAERALSWYHLGFSRP